MKRFIFSLLKNAPRKIAIAGKLSVIAVVIEISFFKVARM